MKIIAVIPVHGRLPLLKLTIQRLLLKNKIYKIICLGETEEEAFCCESVGAKFVWHKNSPLGRKLNTGFRIAKDYNPDAVSFIGSSDWLCDEWFNILTTYIDKYDLCGKRDFIMVHINKKIEVLYWPGYPVGSGREYEPIGIGRILSASVLDKLDWQPFDDSLNCSLDYSMIFSLMQIKGNCYINNSPELQSLSVSCDKWSNLHSFEKEKKNGIIFEKPEIWLKMWFPEIFEL